MFLLEIQPMLANDYVGFTFFIGCMAMMAASAFFFFSMNDFDSKWKTSILVSGLITFIAAVHYWYMRDYYAATGESPTFFRYVDWTLTVPLMCVEFYLLTKAAGAKLGLLWKLIIASVWMLVAGYIGEAMSDGTTGHSVQWGVISTLGYLYILYTAWFGEVAKLAELKLYTLTSIENKEQEEDTWGHDGGVKKSKKKKSKKKKSKKHKKRKTKKRNSTKRRKKTKRR